MFVAVGCLKLCDISGSDSAVAEDSTPLGFGAVSLGKYILLEPLARENEITTTFQNISTLRGGYVVNNTTVYV